MIHTKTFDTHQAMGSAAARLAGETLRSVLASQAEARLLLATGTSQFSTLAHMITQSGVEWMRVTVFHLDEYAGLPETHPASFRKYLLDRFISHVPVKTFHTIRGDAPDLQEECNRLKALVTTAPIDLAMIGIGENGHIAFNDPPADFETEEPYIIVNLDETCRRQQVGEGWFTSFDEVPTQAISMSVRQIMKSRRIICSVPDRRKADAVEKTLHGPVIPDVPASILQEHPNCYLFMDQPAASRLRVQQKWERKRTY
jgi:glucosamine-6-phosphate deaminase